MHIIYFVTGILITFMIITTNEEVYLQKRLNEFWSDNYFTPKPFKFTVAFSTVHRTEIYFTEA